MNQCENCRETIGNLEEPYVYQDNVVCRRCHEKLSAAKSDKEKQESSQLDRVHGAQSAIARHQATLSKQLQEISRHARIHVAPHFPEKKLSNALSTYINGAARSDVIAIIDTSMRKNAKTGVALTTTGIFGKVIMEDSDYIAYAFINEVQLKEKLTNDQLIINSARFGELDLLERDAAKLLVNTIRTIASASKEFDLIASDFFSAIVPNATESARTSGHADAGGSVQAGSLPQRQVHAAANRLNIPGLGSGICPHCGAHANFISQNYLNYLFGSKYENVGCIALFIHLVTLLVSAGFWLGVLIVFYFNYGKKYFCTNCKRKVASA